MKWIVKVCLLIVAWVLCGATEVNSNTSSNLIHTTGMINSRTDLLLGLHRAKNLNYCGVTDVSTKKARPLRILVASTDQYLPIFMNWLIYYHNICAQTALIYFVCLDKAIEIRLPRHGFNCSHVHHLPTVQGNNRLWLVRARVTKVLLEQGYDVLMTDSDALWLRNPFAAIARFPDSDVVASRAAFPEDISAKLGATACMGFVYVRASNRTLLLWEELYAFMSKSPRADDQRNFNQLLLSAHIKYDPKPTYLANKVPNTGSFLLGGQRMRLTLLPHSQFVRMCDPRRKGDTLSAVVAHCISLSKTESTKSWSEKAYGVWALRDRWEEVPFSDMASFVAAISAHNVSQSLQSIQSAEVLETNEK